MISIEKLRGIKHLVTHANCPDGVASALIIKDALPDVEVKFMSHGTEEHRNLASLPGTLFCDFTPYIDRDPLGVDDDGLKEAILKVWIDAGAIVLDHHPTQRDITMRFVEAGLGAYGENERGECGAWLAYEHVWLPVCMSRGDRQRSQATAVREFSELAGVRDTWKKDDPRWQGACEQAEALMFWPFDQQKLWRNTDEIHANGGLGEALFEKKLEAARKSIEESHFFQTSYDTEVAMFQGVSTTSDAAEILEKEYDESSHHQVGPSQPDLVVGFHYRVDAGKLQLQFSMRSHTGYDVGAFAKAHGGGGHKAAAGFTIEQSAELGHGPYRVFQALLEEWEAGGSRA